MTQRAVNVAVKAGGGGGGACKPKLSWLDLSGSGLSALERLCLEEALLRHDPLRRCWAVVGNHDPTHHTRLDIHSATDGDMYTEPSIAHNPGCAVVMGIGGRPERLLDVDLVRDDRVQVIRRFSGGGTVIVDHSSLWTTFVGRTDDLPHVEPFPRPIMKWSADEIFGPAFRSMNERMGKDGVRKKTLMRDSKSSGSENSGRQVYVKEEHSVAIPDFALVETDYVLGGKKIGGNAQAIVKGGWLHHTTFLWDFVDENMNYLTVPEKQPDYRNNRSHGEFLVKLKKYYGHLEGGKKAFFEHVKASTEDAFDIEEISLREALQMIDSELGGFQEWFDGKCRSTIVELPVESDSWAK